MTLALIWIFFYLRDDNGVFLSARNLSNLSLQITVMGFVALGLVFVLLLGEIDLSVAAIVGHDVGDHGRAVRAERRRPVAGGRRRARQPARRSSSCIAVVTVFGPPSFIVSLGAQLVVNGLLLRILPKVGQFGLTDTPLAKIASTYIPTVVAVIVTVVLVVVLRADALVDVAPAPPRGVGERARRRCSCRSSASPSARRSGCRVFARYRGVPLAVRAVPRRAAGVLVLPDPDPLRHLRVRRRRQSRGGPARRHPGHPGDHHLRS